MPPNLNSVSDAELEVLKVLWEKGPGTVRDVEGRLKKGRKRWAYTTILTLLSRLKAKGYVTQEKGERAAHLFTAEVTREELVGRGLTDLAERMCDGTASPLMHALVQSRKLTAAEIAELRQMLDQLEEKE